MSSGMWTGRVFERLKSLMYGEPVLKCPDFNRAFVLESDASDRGVGAVLSQMYDGEDHPVAYFSKKLLPREMFSVVEKECLAIRLAVQMFRVYLVGRLFTIQTDHRSLEWLDCLKESNNRRMRWSLTIQPSQFTVQYRTRKENANADALSRAFETEATGVSLEKVVECQRSEVTLRLRRAERMNRVDVMRHRELDNGSCVQFYSDVLSALQTSHVVCVLIQRSKFVSPLLVPCECSRMQRVGP